MRRTGKAIAIGILVLLVVSGLAYFGVIPLPKSSGNDKTGLTPTITLLDNNGNPETVGSPASWYSASVFDQSGRNITTGQIQLSLTGGFGYNGTVSSWSITGNMTGLTENGRVAGTWTLSASGTGQPPASIPINIQSGPGAASTYAILRIQTLQQDDWGSNYGMKSVSFVVNANLAVTGTDGSKQTAAISNIDIGDVNNLNYEAESSSTSQTQTTTVTNTVTSPAALGISAPEAVIGYIQYNVHVSGVPNHGWFHLGGTCPGGSTCEDSTYTTSDLQTWNNGANVFVQQTEPQTTGVFQYGPYSYTAQWRPSTMDSWISVSTSTTWYDVVGTTSPTQANPSAYYAGQTKDYGAFQGQPTPGSPVQGTGTSLSSLQAQFPSTSGYTIYWLIGGYPVGSNLAVAGSTTTTTTTQATTQTPTKSVTLSCGLTCTTTTTSSYYRGVGGSVVAGTEVLMADGSLKQIQNIQVGDVVMGFDYGNQFNPSGTYASAPSTVLSVKAVPTTALYTFNGVITSDGNQPFYTERGWIQAAHVSVGDTFYNPISGASIPVTSITVVHTNATVYDLQLSPYKSYVAYGILINDMKVLSFADEVMANAGVIFLSIVAVVGVALIVWKRKHK